MNDPTLPHVVDTAQIAKLIYIDENDQYLLKAIEETRSEMTTYFWYVIILILFHLGYIVYKKFKI